MISTKHSDKQENALSRHAVSTSVLLWTAAASAFVSAILSSSGRYVEAAGAVAVSIAVAFIFSARVSVETILIVWFATTPVASFFVRFPTDRSIVTFNRAAVAVAVLALLFNEKEKASLRRFAASRFEIAWLLLSAIALMSALALANDLTYALRMAVDTFLLPLVLFHIARYRFDLRGRGQQLISASITVALFLFATGAYEIVTGANLFQYKGSELVREWALRVNGPFAADSSYAIISLLFVLFLTAAPEVFSVRMDRSARLIYWCAVGGCIAAALLPMFRMVAVALVISLAFFKLSTSIKLKGRTDETRTRAGTTSRFSLSSPLGWLALAVLALTVWAVMFGPYSTERRLTDPRSAYGRLATWESAASLALDNPVAGVGLSNYSDAFNSKYNFRGEIKLEVMETRAADSPHSNWLWIAADLGLPALALFVAANLFLLLMGWRAVTGARHATARAAARCFVALLIAYWLPGLTLASGYYSDLNLYFFFMLGLLSNRGLMSPESI